MIRIQKRLYIPAVEVPETITIAEASKRGGEQKSEAICKFCFVVVRDMGIDRSEGSLPEKRIQK